MHGKVTHKITEITFVLSAEEVRDIVPALKRALDNYSWCDKQKETITKFLDTAALLLK